MNRSWNIELSEAVLAFRGYNVTNLGRTAELMDVDPYRPILQEELDRFSSICSEYTQTEVDLSAFIEAGKEPGLENYAESIAMIVAIEVGQLRILEEVHGAQPSQCKFSYGYSLGELVALSFGGTFSVDEMIRIPLSMAADASNLAVDIVMGVLFSRGPSISESDVQRLCLQITSEGRGTVGVTAVLSPNTYLLMGQQQSVQRFKEIMHSLLPQRAQLRMNHNRWPPLHTPIVRQKHIADRASVMMETLAEGFAPPVPQVFSLVTGSMSYNDHSARDIMRKWVDHPQRLWDAVCETLTQGIETVIHVGPEPNVIPATFRRLSDNVQAQAAGNSLGSLGMRAVSGLVRRPWLTALLPEKAMLLRAPQVKHIVLEEWLIENASECI